MWYGFKDDVIECDNCGECFSASDIGYAYKWNGGIYCSEKCLFEAFHEALDHEVVEDEDGVHWRDHVVESSDDLEELWENELDVKEWGLWSAEDKAEAYGEQLYDLGREA